MITRDMLRRELKEHFIGEEMWIKVTHFTKEDNLKYTQKFKVVEMTKRFLVVDNGKYRLTVYLSDLISQKMNGKI